jgi:hypothetical protein
MPKFTFQIDRVHQVLAPIKFFPTVELTGVAFELAAGDRAIYRGLVELGGIARYTFDLPDRKGYTSDRAQLESNLSECFDELVQI